MVKHQVWRDWVKSAEAWWPSLYLRKEGPALAEMSFVTEGSSEEWTWLLTVAYTCKGIGRITSSYKHQGTMHLPGSTEVPGPLGGGPGCRAWQSSSLLITGTPPIRRHCFRTGVLNQGWFCSLGDIGSCLETFLIVRAQRVLLASSGWRLNIL